LRRESGRASLISLSVSMLAVLAHHEDIREEFEAEQLKPTLMALMQAFRTNTALQHDGLAAIQKAAPPSLPATLKKNSQPFKIVIVGKLSVGKTSLLERACNNTYTDRQQSTIGVHIDFAKIEFPSHNVTLQVYDTAGEERFRSLTRSFYRGAHGAILVYDVSNDESFEELTEFHKDIQTAVGEDIKLLLVGTKIDLKDTIRVDPKKAKAFAKCIGAKHFTVSALQNIGIHKAFRDLTERLVKQWPAGPPTDASVVKFGAHMNSNPNIGCCF